ncbi:MAG: electron transport complex subunit RsxC [Deltaproteobacteria bacterium]|nr:electron transport complex subunit RsxC [Deltaproteobacteria bacterium]
MSKAKTFKGGIHPSYNKHLSSDKEIVEAPLPEVVALPLNQHIGAPAKPIVKRKDKVKAGQLIAETGGFISAPVHASISGIVKAIEPVEHPLGKKVDAIIIESDGKDEWVEFNPVDNPFAADADTIRDKIKEAGIVGLGGATFPSNVKLSPPEDKKIDFVILNGAECEPYLTTDHRLMVEKTEEVVTGLKLAAKVLGVDKIYIGIETNKPDAISKMEKEIGDDGQVIPLQVKYPQGSEKQLISAITGRETPPTSLPMEVGAVVFNVGTCLAIYEAVFQGKPLFERVVTLTGHGVKNPGNFKIRLGTYVAELVEFSGGYKDNAAKLVLGGPMMGRAVPTDGIPIIKGTGGILVMTQSELIVRYYSDCIRCGKCIEACPNNHNPQLLGILIEKERFDKISEEQLEEIVLDDCFECGSCTYVCPAHRPMVQFFQQAKSYFNNKKKKR